jgi:hypothetical protein
MLATNVLKSTFNDFQADRPSVPVLMVIRSKFRHSEKRTECRPVEESNCTEAEVDQVRVYLDKRRAKELDSGISIELNICFPAGERSHNVFECF